MTSLAALFLVASMAAPAPQDGKDKGPDTVTAPTGPAPRLLFVKADADGHVDLRDLLACLRADGIRPVPASGAAVAGFKEAAVDMALEMRPVGERDRDGAARGAMRAAGRSRIDCARW